MLRRAGFRLSMDMISRLDTGLLLSHIAIFIYPLSMFIVDIYREYVIKNK